MSDAAEAEPADALDEPDEEESAGPPSRGRDLLGASTAKIRTKLDELFSSVARGFEDQSDRADAIDDYWDCFNCVSNGNQYYKGIAQIYFPIIHDAVVALVTRYVNQMCPAFGRYIEAITTDGTTPTGIIALLEHYLRTKMFETQVLKPLLRNGDIEGQYNLLVDWGEVRRLIVSRETHGPRIKDETGEEVEAPGDDIDDVREDEVIEGSPSFEVLHDSDVLVQPATADSIEEALQSGGSVTIVRRWSKAAIDKAVDDGLIRAAEGKILKASMDKVRDGASGKDLEKSLAEHVGIKKKGGEATIWMTWTMLPLDEEGKYSEKGEPRLCRIFFGPNRAQLGAKRNPFWNDRCNLLSCPVEKMAGVFKGKSLISYVDSLQYEANDAVNEGADAATLSAAPIVTRDTSKYNGPLVYNVGAVWDIPPDAVKLLTFPDLTPRAQTRVQMALQAIFQSLGVNPSMLPQQTRQGKPNQAQVAQEQQVDLLTTAQGVKVPVEGILTPTLAWCVDLDYQFRDKETTVRAFGDMGIQAEMQKVAPIQNRHGFLFLWRGGEQVKQAAMMQQQGTAWLNVLKGMRQELAAEGYQIHLGPLIEAGTQNIYGAPLGSRVLIDQRHQLTRPPDLENEMMAEGFTVDPHPLDNDVEHLKSHMQALQQTGDPHGTIRVHIQATQQAMQMKQQASMQRALAQQGMKPPERKAGALRVVARCAPQPGATPGPRRMRRIARRARFTPTARSCGDSWGLSRCRGECDEVDAGPNRRRASRASHTRGPRNWGFASAYRLGQSELWPLNGIFMGII